MKKRCSFCGNATFREKEVQYIYRRDGQFMVVNNVPCEECSFCGEQYFKAGTLKRIETEYDTIKSRGGKTSKVMKVPVEEYVKIAG